MDGFEQRDQLDDMLEWSGETKNDDKGGLADDVIDQLESPDPAEPVQEPAPVEEPVVKEEPVVVKEEPAIPDEPVEPVVVKKQEPVVETPVESQADDRDSLIREMRTLILEQAKELNSLKMQVQKPADAVSTQAVPTETPKQEPVQKPAPVFMTPEEHEAMLVDAESANSVLAKVYERMYEAVVREVPQIAVQMAVQEVDMRQAAMEFYNANKDLEPVSEYVGQVYNKLQSQHPDKGIRELLTLTEQTVRKTLGIVKKAEAVDAATQAQSPQKPAFASRPKGSVRGATKDGRSDLQKDFDELLVGID